MDKNVHNLQTSILVKRRTSLGSISSRKRNNNSMSYDITNSSSNYPNYLKTPQRKLRPIAGGSWDDNSLGYGSVAARMRRDRNRAIIRSTQASSTYTNNHTTDASARVENTLNLINTTDLAPWHEENPFAWDGDLVDFYGRQQMSTAATKRSAGSLCNISSPNRLLGEGAGGPSCYRPWDSLSIPAENRRKIMREKLRHSFTSAANHHSSPTSGCASIASSDIDSADFAFFSATTDNDSFFDSDSLFSDSYGVLDTGCTGGTGGGDSGFSTDIFSMLEDGSISCRTPFPNGDWPDSISELNFDCSSEAQYQKGSNIGNCDAHSDIMPASSSSAANSSVVDNRLKKRTKVRRKTTSSHRQTDNKQTCLGSFVPLHTDTDNKIEEEEMMEEDHLPLPPLPLHRCYNKRETETIAEVVLNHHHHQQDLTNPTPATVVAAPADLIIKQPGSNYMRSTLDTNALIVGPPGGNPSNIHNTNECTTSSPSTTTKTTNNNKIPAPAVINLQLDLNLCGNDVTNVVINSVRAERGANGVNGAGATAKTTISTAANSKHVPTNAMQFHHHQGANDQHLTTTASPALKKAFKVSSSASLPTSTKQPQSSHNSIGLTPVRVPITLNLKGWNYMTKDEREGFIERLSHKISTTMSLEEQHDIIRIIGGTKSANRVRQQHHFRQATSHPRHYGNQAAAAAMGQQPFRMSVDDIDSHKLIKLLGYLDTHKGTNGLTGLFSASTSCGGVHTTPTSSVSATAGSSRNHGSNAGSCTGSNSSSVMVGNCSLRRSNSDGNLNTAGIEPQANNLTSPPKGGKSQLPQTRNNTNSSPRTTTTKPPRLSKESRQLLREQRSGLFLNEQKLQIAQADSEDDICVDV